MSPFDGHTQTVVNLLASMLNLDGSKVKIVNSGRKLKTKTADVSTLKGGKAVHPGEDYDTILITLFDSDAELIRDIKAYLIISKVVHELLHVKYPEETESYIFHREKKFMSRLIQNTGHLQSCGVGTGRLSEIHQVREFILF